MYSTRLCKYWHDPLCLVFIPISLLLLSWMLSIVLTLRFSLPLKEKYFFLCMITFSPEYGDFSILLRVIDLMILKEIYQLSDVWNRWSLIRLQRMLDWTQSWLSLSFVTGMPMARYFIDIFVLQLFICIAGAFISVAVRMSLMTVYCNILL